MKRGAIVKALAFGSKNKILLEPLSQVIEATLDSIIKVTDLNATSEANVGRYRLIISKVFACINANPCDTLVNRNNFIERAVSMDYNMNCRTGKPSLF